ncbi:hypothetical protein MTR_0443s0010 [Medicago truncatula]|uniref:Uncharacterized protein n=1 Tax=Medicago truncatula TaxID=3880 RepID=A0A072TFE3_MEDTR|nr:hypothetical protein MTR_0443s0010 [Medicago truncatula]
MNIGWIESWSKRKGLGADWMRKYERLRDKNMSPPSQKPGTAVPPSRVTFATFA